ncbi:hypothetical protein LBH_0043 [Lactobacillus helveticus H9]|nr:hypothetical protein LBH_0043 [Lactobacillus helveticus H9]
MIQMAVHHGGKEATDGIEQVSGLSLSSQIKIIGQNKLRV